ncbi:hypothetical protein BDQ17DRAFT_953416 [Cyathus striatus]|nr:hypothetical protein BDQ17DRAFT_953416 [Cyathus striatus]
MHFLMFCCRGGCLLMSTLLSHRFTLHSIGCLKPPKTTIPSLRATQRAVSLMIWTDVVDESVSDSDMHATTLNEQVGSHGCENALLWHLYIAPYQPSHCR